MASREQRAKNHKKKWIIKFAAIVASIVAVFLIIAIPVASKFYNNETGEFNFNLQKNEPPKKSTDNDSENDISDTSVESSTNTESLKINIAIFGVDKAEALTDVIIVAMYNSETNKTDLIWVPRDTKVSIPDSRRQVLLNEGRKVPSSVKINEVHSYSGKKRANEYSTLQVEEVLGIDIDNYVVVDLKAFKFIVDTLGGVYFDVPRDMDYEDPAQDLYIHLKAGYQLLDGDKAEQFVRFRKGYGNQDLGRINAQQEFIKKLFGQALTKESIMGNLIEYIYAFFKYIDTDFNLADVPKYVKFLGDLNINDMTTYTIPGTTDPTYFYYDPVATKELVTGILNAKPAEKNDNSTRVSSTNNTIKVLNGGSVNGLAQKMANMLEEQGYNNVTAGNYNGTRQLKTRIIVGSNGMGQDLTEIFGDSEIIVDESQLVDGSEIVIVLGTGER